MLKGLRDDYDSFGPRCQAQDIQAADENGAGDGDFARVSIPAVGEKTLVWRSSLAYMSDAAFLGAAGQWAAQGKGADHAR